MPKETTTTAAATLLLLLKKDDNGQEDKQARRLLGERLCLDSASHPISFLYNYCNLEFYFTLTKNNYPVYNI